LGIDVRTVSRKLERQDEAEDPDTPAQS